MFGSTIFAAFPAVELAELPVTDTFPFDAIVSGICKAAHVGSVGETVSEPPETKGQAIGLEEPRTKSVPEPAEDWKEYCPELSVCVRGIALALVPLGTYFICALTTGLVSWNFNVPEIV
jgi:hypothetical protein